MSVFTKPDPMFAGERNEIRKSLDETETSKPVILAFCNEVDALAQELMMADGQVSGKHYAAMRLILKRKFSVEWGR